MHKSNIQYRKPATTTYRKIGELLAMENPKWREYEDHMCTSCRNADWLMTNYCSGSYAELMKSKDVLVGMCMADYGYAITTKDSQYSVECDDYEAI